jgi:phospholipase/carboxylesterase
MSSQADVEDALKVWVPALLGGMERMSWISRHLHPPQLADCAEALQTADADLAASRGDFALWPSEYQEIGMRLAHASQTILSGMAALRIAVIDQDLTGAYRALGSLAKAQDVIYPLAPAIDAISKLFLPERCRQDQDLVEALAAGPVPDATGEVVGTGIMHARNDWEERGGFSLYVPENYDASRAHPLIVALHGGSGHGRSFLYSWLREARARGAILAAPTSSGTTWALQGSDPDTPALHRLVELVSQHWSVDPTRRLLTGMSDGGTFCYVSGFEPNAPFTHLAPVSAAFHPMLAAAASRERLDHLPIFIAHGALDWMFPVAMAKDAAASLTRVGADITFREIADLSHTWPSEICAEIIDWMMG